MKKLPLVIFAFIMAMAFCSSASSYRRAQNRVDSDVNNALQQVLAQMQCDVISADTIQCYRSHLTIAELRDTACIAMCTVRREGERAEEIVAQANCGFLTILKLSDQRASATLLCIGLLWLAGSMWYMRRFHPQPIAQGICYGGIVYVGDRFTTAGGKPIRLTPMQHSLLQMFMDADGHTLSKQEICDRLWPKKPDASDTLYTLIRRIKPVIEAHSNLRIECDRGKSYSLNIK